MATERLNLQTNSQKSSPQKLRGMKLKLYINVHYISLYKSGISCDVALVLSLLWLLKFPLAYNGKRENWPLLLSHCKYFDKSFTEMFSFFQVLPRQLKG